MTKQTQDTKPTAKARLQPDMTGKSVGEFRIERLLGRGGMGQVYLAEQVSLKRKVALKILNADLASDENYLRRFQAEAKAVAPIHHPNIVSVFAIGADNGTQYIALEYVQGRNLREYLSKKGTLSLPECISIMRKVASALQRAKEEGIVHRDIKPENVLLTKKGEVKVADFGLARVVTEDVSLTQSGVTLGTPLYMSPEQVQGKDLDHRSDIYSFGVMCYHMMAGHPPYMGETAMAVALQHVNGTPPDLATLRPDVPTVLIDIITRMMEKDRTKRYQSAKELLRDLGKIKLTREQSESDDYPTIRLEVDDGEQPTVRPAQTNRMLRLTETISRLGARFSSRSARISAVALSLVLAGLAGATLGWAQREPDPLKGKRNLQTQPPDTSAIRRRENGALQLFAASYAPEADREAALWAVLAFHPGDEESSISAARQLLETYLERGDHSQSLVLAGWLTARDDRMQQMFGHLFKGIVLSRIGEPRESMESFARMFGVAEPARRLNYEQRVWLASQYLLALNVNYEVLGSKRDPTMVNRFWSNVLGIGRA